VIDRQNKTKQEGPITEKEIQL